MAIVPIITYSSIAVFAVAVAARFVRFKSMPIHLRWELYPVPREAGKYQYGGSYLEEFEWWTEKRKSSKINELAFMIPEILLLKGVWEHNRSQWIRSFPFHFGLYVIAGLVVLMLAGGLARAAGSDISAGGSGFGLVLYHSTYLAGWLGISLAFIGSVFLLCRRLFNANYSEYTKGSDYFNLAFFVVTSAIAIAAHATSDPDFARLGAYFQNLVTFNLAGYDAAFDLMTVEIVLGSLLFAYIPLTHMSHFVGKFFMYHEVRWSDEPNTRGGDIEKKVTQALAYPVSWKAPHIGGDGKKNWVDVVTDDAQKIAKENTK